MSISNSRYVSITSGVIGAQAVAQRELIGLRFTTDPRVPVDGIITVDSDGAADYFGASAPETIFANQYFGYISPAPASQARALRFAAWPDVARPARIYGARTPTTLSAFQAVTSGALNLTLGGIAHELTGINLASATTLALVAAALQTAIRAYSAGGAPWTTATVTYDAVGGSFNLVSGTIGAGSVDVNASIAQTDLGPLLGWISPTTVYSPGSAAQTPLEAFLAAEQITDSFGSFSFGNGTAVNAILTVAQALAVAQYVAAQNVKYEFLVQVSKANYGDFRAALQGLASNGMILNVAPLEWKEALASAIMAATNYDRRNATVNYMYRQYGFTADVTTDAEANALDAARVNYYGETSSAGQKVTFFQRGFLNGGATAPLDMNVHANEQWLKAFLQARLLSLQLSVGKIPANNDGRGMVQAQVMEGVNQGKFNGTISLGKTLTVAQQIAVTQLTGDPEAWRAVQTNGFWLDVTIIQRTGPSGATEYIAQYTLAYSKNDVVRAIEGSHNLI